MVLGQADVPRQNCLYCRQGHLDKGTAVRRRCLIPWTAPEALEDSQVRIAIASPQETVPIDRSLMRNAARSVLEGEGIAEAEISLAFVDNSTIHQLNKRYLQHDEPTDVLSFP